MKTNLPLPSILAGIAVGSLLIYVLACATSFSPDDRRVLYPSFDPQSGAAAVALYDRRTGRSEILFSAAETAAATNQHAAPIRAGWLPDGKHILIASAVGDDGLDLLVLPRGVKEPVRHFSIPKAYDVAAFLQFPFAVVGEKLLLNGDGHNPLRLDLVTGETAGGERATNEICALPSPDGKAIVGFRDLRDNRGMEFGTFNLQSMEFKSLGQAGTNICEGTIPAFDPANGRLMFIGKTGEQLQLQVMRNNANEFTRPLTLAGAKLQTGPFLDLARDGKTVMTAYCATSAATTNSEYGLLEIPLGHAPLRFTPLFQTKGGDKEDLIVCPTIAFA